jgi:hypothetical protein
MLFNNNEYLFKKGSAKPVYVPSFKLSELPNGNYFNTANAEDFDEWHSSFELYGTRDELENFVSDRETFRDIGQINIPFTFDSEEYVFGPNILYDDPIYCEIKNKLIIQKSENGFSLEVKIRHVGTIQFDATVSNDGQGRYIIPTIQYVKTGYVADADYTYYYNTNDGGSSQYSERDSDTGMLKLSATVSQEDAATIMQSYTNGRGEDMSFTGFSGLTDPFGSRKNAVYPLIAKMLKVDVKKQDINFWSLTMTISEVK